MHRIFAALLVFMAAAPGFSQTILKYEPLHLAPYETAYVYSASCGAGMALKVTGSMRNLPRKKVCVPSSREQASLLDTPLKRRLLQRAGAVTRAR
jgi:hypothetical protein